MLGKGAPSSTITGVHTSTSACWLVFLSVIAPSLEDLIWMTLACLPPLSALAFLDGDLLLSSITFFPFWSHFLFLSAGLGWKVCVEGRVGVWIGLLSRMRYLQPKIPLVPRGSSLTYVVTPLRLECEEISKYGLLRPREDDWDFKIVWFTFGNLWWLKTSKSSSDSEMSTISSSSLMADWDGVAISSAVHRMGSVTRKPRISMLIWCRRRSLALITHLGAWKLDDIGV